MTSSEIELAMYKYLNVRQGAKILVPNISWGLFDHECDLLLVSGKEPWATEIEIKISRADIKKDLEKRHGHKSKYIRELYFAIPTELEYCIDLIPEHAGIFVVTKKEITRNLYGSKVPIHSHYQYAVKTIRKAVKQINTIPLSQEMIRKLCYLATFRTWTHKENNVRLQNKISEITKGKKLL